MKQQGALEDALNGQPQPQPLTPGEIEVMDYLVQGLVNQEIADLVGIGKGSIVKRIAGARVKLRAIGKSRKALVAAYLAVRTAS